MENGGKLAVDLFPMISNSYQYKSVVSVVKLSNWLNPFHDENWSSFNAESVEQQADINRTLVSPKRERGDPQEFLNFVKLDSVSHILPEPLARASG